MVERGLQDARTLVTGALRGIGLATAVRLAAEGAQVLVTDLSPPDDPLVGQVLDRLGPAARYLPLDVTAEADWERARGWVESRWGSLDVLVNNAGTDLVGPVDQLDLAAWHRLMRVNVDSVFLGVRSFTAALAAGGAGRRGGASVINVASIMGLVGFAETSAYNTSKGAVRLFSKAVAIEFAQAGKPIRVNSIHPGFVETPLLHVGMQRWVDQGKAARAQDLLDGIAAMTPVKRLAQPEEIAAAIAFLASTDASYLTGAELVVDGGWTAQ
ncbi:SDR family oxidoreductase [Niveispirillum sp. SYP-B3756]|uniref:SDR family NAD(P)-dependent oxidoreductase n=1 Tax=Niveispirillum sp. SYP-B3756 TaxID=2662178 RepID=UPI0012922079|nr:SDR family oxidoreductase [Niveispirillum sp. SYP-B3756]MQP64943.1 SDR family oxidoreductase [Niveispirillum sp. SYP-B3756]